MIVRVAVPGQPAFQLRKGEEGISVFDTERVDPPLSDREVLEAFRAGSVAIGLTADDLAEHGLILVPVSGAESLPERLQASHAEIRPAAGLNRAQFKQALRELEPHDS
jgi:hypothetical protein